MLEDIGKRAAKAKAVAAMLDTSVKNKVLYDAADAIINEASVILSANERDMENAKAKGMAPALLDRLLLTDDRILQIAEGLKKVASLDDPIGEVCDMKTRPNGLLIGQMRVPMGVIGVIYEARPNVTPDVFSLCFKAGSACVLKGGSDAIESNKAFVKVLRKVLSDNGLCPDLLQLIEDTSRQATVEFMHMNDYVDLLIPRGGAGLISTVVRESTIPVIQTGTGNCHVYVDESADIDMAIDIIYNAKTTRIGVCNAMESLVVHSKVLESLLPGLERKLSEKDVELRADERAIKYLDKGVPAKEEDFGTEYLDYILSIKTVDSIEEAIAHINKYSTGHSESIITKDYNNSRKFLREIDSAAVYVNASTRFTDGFEFGLGAEIGISTQKMHARGPMGLKELTSYKYIIYGNGQVRN